MKKNKSPHEILNDLGAMAHKKIQPKEGSPEEEMAEPASEAKAEGDLPKKKPPVKGLKVSKK